MSDYNDRAETPSQQYVCWRLDVLSDAGTSSNTLAFATCAQGVFAIKCCYNKMLTYLLDTLPTTTADGHNKMLTHGHNDVVLVQSSMLMPSALCTGPSDAGVLGDVLLGRL